MKKLTINLTHVIAKLMRQKALVVGLNKSVKIRFKEGDELVVRIVEQKQMDQIEPSEDFLIDVKAPIAQAILGHAIGEKIKYRVEGNLQQLDILEIKS